MLKKQIKKHLNKKEINFFLIMNLLTLKAAEKIKMKI